MRVDNTMALNAYNMAKTQNLGREKAVDDAALREQTDAFEAFLVKEILDIALKILYFQKIQGIKFTILCIMMRLASL